MTSDFQIKNNSVYNPCVLFRFQVQIHYRLVTDPKWPQAIDLERPALIGLPIKIYDPGTRSLILEREGKIGEKIKSCYSFSRRPTQVDNWGEERWRSVESRVATATAFNGNRLERDACARIIIPAAPPPFFHPSFRVFCLSPLKLSFGSDPNSIRKSRVEKEGE